MGQNDYFECMCVESDDVGMVVVKWVPSGSFNVSIWGVVNLGVIDGIGSKFEVMNSVAHNMARSDNVYLSVANKDIALRPAFEGQIVANTWFEGCIIYSIA